MLRYFTAGESHGPCLTVIIDGVPAGFPFEISKVNHDLWRRQQGYGRGGRMLIEKDEVQVRSGIRWGETLGSPVALGIENRDWKNWTKKMSPAPEDRVIELDPGRAFGTGAHASTKLCLAAIERHEDDRRVARTFLDAGCGSGFFSAWFIARGCRTYSLDYSEEALEMARKATDGRSVIPSRLCSSTNSGGRNLNSFTRGSSFT